MLPSLRLTFFLAMIPYFVASGEGPITDNQTFAFSKKNLVADMITTTTHQSRWGPIVLEERAALQIRNDSKFRIDYELGHSYIVVPRYRTRLDAELRIATQNFINTEEHVVKGRPEWRDLKKTRSKDLVEGWKVTVYRHTVPLFSPGPGVELVANGSEQVREYWVADDLNIPLITRYVWPGTEVVRRLTNIRLGDPGREAFEIPDGYRMLSFVSGKASDCPLSIRTTVTGSGKVENGTFLAAGCQE